MHSDHDNQEKPIPRPQLTFPSDEADCLLAYYRSAQAILEYGGGGSTVMAAENAPGTTITVESDLQWAEMLRRYLEQRSLAQKVHVYHVDIGPTRGWGFPTSFGFNRIRFPGYVTSVRWQTFFSKPDVVLIDGRFRVACLLSVALHTERQTTVLFDDYTNRPQYHVVERYLRPKETVGRMALFEIEASQIGPSAYLDYLQYLFRPG